MGTGSAGEGLMYATIRDGKLDSFTIDPRLMRLPSGELAEHVMTAVNAALDDLRGRQASVDQPVDVDVLAESLGEVQDRSVRQMARMNDALRDVVALLREPPR
ncbi:hypothetical protein [Micromonospora sp. NPDC049240]|uniref:hypothetical protein n=1 Tax=Micromonospora sp. NPDC049240 TaxID=3155151 RepID=UPI0033D76E13